MSDDVAQQRGSVVCGATEQAAEPPKKVGWEECKENFQPVKDGRKPEVLANCGTKCTKGVLQPKGVEEERRRFVDAIERYQGNDPLEKWLDYIKWTKDTFVSGGQKSEMLPLLEKCTREFHKDERYKDDVRYLRVWIQYADCLPDPSDVFSFLMDHEIGQGHALFYIAYATFCEFKRNYAVADAMYQKGIEKQATPVDRLEQKFSEFQHRMVRRIQRKASEQQQRGTEESERRGLKTIRGSSTRPVGGKRRNTSSNVGSSSIPVFVDEEFSSSSVRKPPSGTMVLPGHNESQKENIQAAMPWVGQTIMQKASRKTIKPQETLEIMEDPEFASSAIVDTSGEEEKNKMNKISLRQRFEKDGLEEQLSSDPLKLLKNPPPKEESKPPSPFETDEMDADVTVGTSEAYKAMNCLFTGKATSPSPVKESAVCELEPTMTINTRDALNAVNQMFEASFNVGRDAVVDPQEGDDREETIYISSDAPEEEDGGLMIREDTVFLSNATAQEDDHSPGLVVREDTVFLSEAAQTDDGAQSPATFSIREDTVFLGNGEGSLDIREDTVFITDLPDRGALEGDETEIIPGNELNRGQDNVRENDENAVPEGLIQIPNRERKHFPLSPLDQEELIRNEISVEYDEEAENVLATMHNVEDEGFTVLPDLDPEQRRINPFDASFQRRMVETLNPPVNQWPDVYNLGEDEALACEKILKGKSGGSHLVVDGAISASISGKIGSGSYATIYGGVNEDGSELALKLEYPPCPWEWLLCKALEGRAAPDACRIVRPVKMLLSEKFSIIVMPKSTRGTLQDLLNRYLGASLSIDQSITAKISLEIFKAMKQLHTSKIVHNDIKPDNITYDISGDGSDLRVSLIDIGRGVDLELLPANCVLFGDSDTESFRCVEMRERTPWLWQADTYAVACTIHCLIFGQYMEVDRVIHESTGESFIRSRAKFPRTYDNDTWEDVFRRLLNVTSASPDSPPDWEYLCQQMNHLLSDGSVAKKFPAELKRLVELTTPT